MVAGLDDGDLGDVRVLVGQLPANDRRHIHTGVRVVVLRGVQLLGEP
jgi:hypothetical protein